jgi:hypothetical protein
MAQFPTTPKPQLPYNLETEWRTIVSAFDSGNEQRRQKWDFPKYNVSLNYNALEATSVNTLWDFYQDRKGSYEAFHFYTLEAATWTVYVGTGDGTATVFDLGGQNSTLINVYFNGASQSTANWSLTTGGGESSSDRISFSSVATCIPASTDVITAKFAGNMRIRCRFDTDKMSKQAFEAALFKTGLNLKGLLAT